MSKCIKKCKLDELKQVCTGCGRTLEEIRNAYYEQNNGL